MAFSVGETAVGIATPPNAIGRKQAHRFNDGAFPIAKVFRGIHNY
jgi:hypothetical protein